MSMQPPRPVVSPSRPAAAPPRAIPGAGRTGPSPAEIQAQREAAAAQLAAVALAQQEAAALRQAQLQAEQEQARRNQERIAANQQAQHVLDQLPPPATQEDEDEEEAAIFAAAEAAARGELPAQPVEAGAFDPNEACYGGFAASWSYHDALMYPIDPDVFEYRIITQTADGDFLVRRYFLPDSRAYESYIRPIADATARIYSRVVQARCGSNVLLMLPRYDIVVFAVEEWDHRERARDAALQRPSSPEEALAAAIGSAGIDNRLLQLAAQHGDSWGRQANAQVRGEDAPVPAQPVGNVPNRPAKAPAAPAPKPQRR